MRRCVGPASALLLGARVAFADPCGRPDLISAFPPDGAPAVPIDAMLSAVYAETADYLGETVTLSGPEGTRELRVSFDPSERRLSALDATLAPNQSYTLDWPALRGLTSAGHGRGASVTFSTGSTQDLDAPSFAGIRGLRGDVDYPRDDCTDELEERMTFDFSLGAADDDGGRESLALLLFQTRGPALPEGAPKLVALQAWPASSTAHLELPVDDATGRVCFAAVARDLLGRTSPTGSDEHCVELSAPPFFYGCAIAPAAAPGAGVGLAALVGIVAWRRRRRRT